MGMRVGCWETACDRGGSGEVGFCGDSTWLICPQFKVDIQPLQISKVRFSNRCSLAEIERQLMFDMNKGLNCAFV
jgi:hypothetical protein